MLLGEDDITDDVITFGPCFEVFVYIRADWRKSDNSVDREPQGIWWWSIKFHRCSCKSPSFSCPAGRALGELARRLDIFKFNFTGMPLVGLSIKCF